MAFRAGIIFCTLLLATCVASVKIFPVSVTADPECGEACSFYNFDLAHFQSADLTGSMDDPLYVGFLGPMTAKFVFNLPSNFNLASAQLHVNYKGTSQPWQNTNFALKNFATDSYDTALDLAAMGYTEENSWKWSGEKVSPVLSSTNGNVYSNNGVVEVRMVMPVTTSPNCEVDYLALEVTEPLCSNACGPHGVQEADCSCTCSGMWSGAACDVCMNAGSSCSAMGGGVIDAATCTCDGNCNAGFGGSNCDMCDATYCGAHGTAQSDCTCQCVGGYKGPRCSTCETVCENGGELQPDCTCTCAAGFGGPTCSGECATPCMNGGIHNNDCSCSCPAPWTGHDCSTCGLTGCANSGTLNSADEVCSCECLGGWTGRSCDVCEPRECQNFGSFIQSSCSCECNGFWTGAECNSCPEESPCLNGGAWDRTTCTCACPSNFEGEICETEKPPSAEPTIVYATNVELDSRCPSASNGIACAFYNFDLAHLQSVDLSGSMDDALYIGFSGTVTAYFTFALPEGYQLNTARVRVNYKGTSQPWQNTNFALKNVATDSYDKLFDLEAMPYPMEESWKWSGEKVSPVLSSTNGNVYSNNGVVEVRMVMPITTSPNCEIDYLALEVTEPLCSNACGPHGVQEADCSCTCSGMWSGAACDVCMNAGSSCSAMGGGVIDAATCTCDGNCNAGFGGSNCDMCDATYCGAHGTAQSDCTCQCENLFSGARCNTCDAMCENGGTLSSDCSCSCPNGFGGARCETPCANSCNGKGHMGAGCQCQCHDPWAGEDCNTCSRTTCQHGGTVYGVTCSCINCDNLWSGDDCESCDVTCANGGVLDESTCTCSCSGLWTGLTCETCPDTLCMNGGTFVNTNGECKCVCTAAWAGHTCSSPSTPVDANASSVEVSSTEAYVGYAYNVEVHPRRSNGAALKYPGDFSLSDLDFVVSGPAGMVSNIQVAAAGKDGSVLRVTFTTSSAGDHIINVRIASSGDHLTGSPATINAVVADAMDMKVAVFTPLAYSDPGMVRYTTSGDSCHNLIRQTLTAMGIPHDFIGVKPIVDAGGELSLYNLDGSAKYYATIFASGPALEYDDGTGAWPSAFSGNWNLKTQLEDFERRFNIRRIVLGSHPWSEPAVDFVSSSMDRVQLFLHPNAENFATGLKPGANFFVKSYYTATTITDSTSTTPMVTDSNGNAAAVKYVAPDGREQMHGYWSFSPLGGQDASLAFFPAMVQWATRNTYVGNRRIFLSMHIDDHMLYTETWNQADEANTGLSYQDTCEDLDFHINWQNSASSTLPTGSMLKLDLAINGFGGTYDEGRPESEKLGKCTFDRRNDFFMVSHTYTHQSLDAPRDYDGCLNDLQLNKDWLINNVCPADDNSHCSMNGLVPPMITGLFNGDALRAMETVGIRGAVGDNTRPELRPNNMFHPIISSSGVNGHDGIIIAPRHATYVFYNCMNEEQNLNLIKHVTQPFWFRLPTFDGVSLFDIYMKEGEDVVSYLAGYQHDAFMFHQANLHVFDWVEDGVTRTDSLTTMWARAVLRQMDRFNALPIRSLSFDEHIDLFEERMNRDSAAPAGRLFVKDGEARAVGVSTSGSNAARVVVSGVVPESTSSRMSTTSYGPDNNLFLSMAAQDSATVKFATPKTWSSSMVMSARSSSASGQAKVRPTSSKAPSNKGYVALAACAGLAFVAMVSVFVLVTDKGSSPMGKVTFRMPSPTHKAVSTEDEVPNRLPQSIRKRTTTRERRDLARIDGAL